MKNQFSNKSLAALKTCDERLIFLFNEVLKVRDCSIIFGYRGKDEQNQLFKEGKSKLKYPDSKHNNIPSLAVDAIPYPSKNEVQYFYQFSGYVLAMAAANDIKIRWGGDWDMDNDLFDQSFMDLWHYELVT